MSLKLYDPFGTIAQEWRITGTYRYSFNGKESDSEWDGGGAMFDYGFRIYDPRLGRFLSVDPLTTSYPSWSPYPFAMNRPIDGVDLDGLEHTRYPQPGNNGYHTAESDATSTRPTVAPKFIPKPALQQPNSTTTANQVKTTTNTTQARVAPVAPSPIKPAPLTPSSPSTPVIPNPPPILPPILSTGLAVVALTVVFVLIPNSAGEGSDGRPVGSVGRPENWRDMTDEQKVIWLENHKDQEGWDDKDQEALEYHKELVFAKTLRVLDDKELKKAGIDAHKEKYEILGNKAKVSEYDFAKDPKTGDLFLLRKKPYRVKKEDHRPRKTDLNIPN